MKKSLFLLSLILCFHLLLLINLQFTAWPEMFSFPFLLSNGFLLYQDMVHPYPPVLTLGLSIVFKLFGMSALVLKIFTWSLILINDLLVYLISIKLTKNRRLSLLAAFVYSILQATLDGNMLWFDFAITTPVLLGLFLLMHKGFKTVFLSGVFLMLAGLTKQTGGIFYIAALFFLLFNRFSIKQIICFLLGSTIILVPLVIRLSSEQSLIGFWNWVVYYPSKYWTSFPGYVQMYLNKREFFVLAVLIIAAITGYTKLKEKPFKKLILLFAIIGVFSVYPRFSFFHLQPALPFLSILIARNKKHFVLAFIAIFILINFQYLKSNWNGQTRFLQKQDLVRLEVIKNLTLDSKNIYLLGLPSHYYAFLEKTPPKPWFDNYGWYFEVPNQQLEVLEKWSKNPPQKIIWQFPQSGNWYEIGVYQPATIAEWIKNNYTLLGNVDGEFDIWKLNKL